MNFNPNQMNFNPNQMNFNPNQMNFNPNQMNFNPNQMNFDPNQMNFNPNQMNFNPNQMNFNPMAMNINPMQMIMQMQNNNFPNDNNPEEDYDDEIETMWIFNKSNTYELEKVLSEITDKRKKINFIDTKNNRITKYFPIYFTKNELYTYINGLNAQETILFYKNDILDNNESSIQDIEDNSTITLFPNPKKNYIKSSLYKYINNLYPKLQKK